MPKKVIILQEWIPHYREPFFKHLREIGLKSGVEYKVVAGQEPGKALSKIDQGAPSQIDVFSRNIVINVLGREILIQKFPLFRDSVDLVICEHALRNLRIDFWSFFRKPRKLAFWGHGKTRTKEISPLETYLKKRMLKKADWYFAYTKSGAEYIVANGYPGIKVTCLLNSTDTRQLLREIDSITLDEMKSFKASLSIRSEPVGVYIGALNKSKRLDFLIEASIIIKQEVTDFRLLIFGEGSSISLVQSAASKYPFISYGGAANLRTKALIAEFASVILMPGRVGLISVDSMVMGLPIATTNWNYHAPEFDYLTHGHNAFITENDPKSYAHGVIKLFRDSRLLESLKNNCKDESRLYSIENMVDKFHAGVLTILTANEVS